MNTAADFNKLSAEQLAQLIINQEEWFILDVRNEKDFKQWSLEGEQLEVVNIPYFELLDGVESQLDKIPVGKKVLVVCAKEGSSQFVAEQLIEAGRKEIYFLEGGMKAWSEHLVPVKIADLRDGGEVYQFNRIGKGCLSYMVISDGEAAVIDPIRRTTVYENFARERNATIKHAIDTHLHADHISGGRTLAYKVGAAYWLPPKDASEVTFSYHRLEEGRELDVGTTKVHIQPVYSPGHTIGSTSLLVDNSFLFTGDILFIESIGRPDLAGSAGDWADDLHHTLYGRYTELSDNLVVLPAHFGKLSELGEGGRVAARIGDLYANNPGLNIPDEAEFKRTVTENLPPQPNAYKEIRQTNMGLRSPDEEEQREMEVGPNRCAVHDN